MNKPNVTKFLADIHKGISKHSPEILTGIGIAGMITTTILAVKATPKALILIEEEKRKQNRELLEEAKQNNSENCARVDRLKPLEAVKVAWKPYVPAAVTGIISIGCMVGANSVHARRNAALATAYQISSTALSEYKEKVVETIGEKKEKSVQDKVAQERVNKRPVGTTGDVIITGTGTTLCFDPQFGKYFESDIETIRAAVNSINYEMLQNEYASINDFYCELGIDPIAIGDELGWNIGRDGKMDVDFSSTIAKNGKPCIVLQYTVAPKYEYFKLA